MATEQDQQLGDFVKGRLLFVEAYCKDHGQDVAQALETVKREALRLAGAADRVAFLENRIFGGVVLSSSRLPGWVDGVFLEAITIALKGPKAPLFTNSSRMPCVTSEAGRFNAHRQADTVFKAYFSGKTPEAWLKSTFLNIYRQCYGEEAARRYSVEEMGPGHFHVTMDNRGLGKASRMDCSTGVGYLYGALEKLGAKDIVVNHDQCGAAGTAKDIPCLFDVTWK